MPRKVLLALLAVVLVAGGVGAIIVATVGDDDADTDSEPARTLSPFTGQPIDRLRPTLTVKIDNVPAARPPAGLEGADIVYVEPVEGGLSRILAVYSSRLPPTVGPVRSARESDIELLRQFDRPALANSGANTGVMALIRESPIIDISANQVSTGYVRDPDRPVPSNLMTRPAELLANAPQASQARDIGFRFGSAPDGGTDETSTTVRYASARLDFTWSAEQRRWLVAMDGAPARAAGGGRLGAPTVVVQEVNVTESRFSDTRGAFSPFVETVGSGEATVLRDGRSYPTSWSRPSAADGTEFTTESGEPMTFSPGQVWVVFTPRDG